MKAIITGATGQCGGYLAEMLLNKGYEVYAMVRRNTCFDLSKSPLGKFTSNDKFCIVRGDVTDQASINELVEKIKPNEFYNAASQSHVHDSWEYPIATAQINAIGTLVCLEAIRRYAPYCKFLQFSTSELFGKAVQSPQNESTPFYPRSPYAVSKLYAYWIVVNYRESYDLFACNAILFNMESPRRGKDFVTQKIARGVAKIKWEMEQGLTTNPLLLGNLDCKRDWNDARNSLEFIWKMLQKENPDDFVIGSGENHSIREFLKEALNVAEIEYTEEGDKFLSKDGKLIVGTNPKFLRPAEVFELKADPSKAVKELDYNSKRGFKDLVREMTIEAYEEIKRSS